MAMKQTDVSSLRMLRRARDRIDRDYADPIDIPALAAGAGYSREHFIRAFHAAYGETPGRYRTRRRVERACELLRSANLTVTEICHLVGFTSLGRQRRDVDRVRVVAVDPVPGPAQHPQRGHIGWLHRHGYSVPSAPAELRVS
jgi:AraC-like DNA-binding protein